jgi:transposase
MPCGVEFDSVVGIDVSKASLDVAFGIDTPVQQFPNNDQGHRSLAKALKKRSPSRVILEATGGYERRVLRHLVDQKFNAIRINPRQSRDFARASGILAKSDAIDARVLVRFGAVMQPPTRSLPSPEQERLARLEKCRAQLVAARTVQKNYLDQETDEFVRETITNMIDHLKEAIDRLEAESAEVIAQHKQLERTYQILTSVPGVGPVTAAVLLGQMPELGTLSRQAAAALAGLAPFNHDSGMQRGQRHIRGGRAAVRTALYMAAFNGVHKGTNTVLLEDFDRMIKGGKPYKVAMTACMRKLLTILNALVREDLCWDEKNPVKSTQSP